MPRVMLRYSTENLLPEKKKILHGKSMNLKEYKDVNKSK
jgi:hypothetical protein